MDKPRYIVEYFPENSDSMETSFVEADSKDEAKRLVVDRFGAFINIVACNISKSSGGPGAKFQPEVPVQLADNDLSDTVETSVVVKPKKVKVTKEPVVKTPKDSSKTPKVKTESYATRTRRILTETANLSFDEKVQCIATELEFTVQKAKGYVTFYSK